MLNLQSEFNEEVIEKVPVLPPCLELDPPPTEEELETALSKMKKCKAGGKSGILPELVLYGGGLFWDKLLKLMQDVWSEGKVMADWKDAAVIPITKKGRPSTM